MNRRVAKQKSDQTQSKKAKEPRPLGAPLISYDETLEWCQEYMDKDDKKTPMPAIQKVKYIGIAFGLIYVVIIMWAMIQSSCQEVEQNNLSSTGYASNYAISESPAYQPATSTPQVIVSSLPATSAIVPDIVPLTTTLPSQPSHYRSLLDSISKDLSEMSSRLAEQEPISA